MAYPNGMDNAGAAVKLPYLVKGGLFQAADRGLIDDALPNGWRFYADNAAGTGRLHYLVAVDTASKGNQTSLTNANGVNAWALTLAQVATPAAPTITTAGTPATTSYSYRIVASNGFGVSLGTTAASAAGSTTTGAAILTSANYNVIAFTAVSGAASYTIYRSASSGTPSTTGIIGTVAATVSLSTGVQTATYVFNDTGLVGDATSFPTSNTTGALSAPVLAGGINIPVLSTPVNVVATPQGTAGAVTITYQIVANAVSGHTAASASGTTTTANSTLTTGNNVLVTWDAVPNAVSYTVYRTAAGGTPSTTGVVATVNAPTTSFTDTGVAGDSTSAPSSNTTGSLVLSSISLATGPNYVASSAGSSNAATFNLTDPNGNNVALAAGLRVTLQLGVSLQAGANTIAMNGGSAKNLFSHRTGTSGNIAVAYTATGCIDIAYNGVNWMDMSQ